MMPHFCKAMSPVSNTIWATLTHVVLTKLTMPPLEKRLARADHEYWSRDHLGSYWDSEVRVDHGRLDALAAFAHGNVGHAGQVLVGG